MAQDAVRSGGGGSPLRAAGTGLALLGALCGAAGTYGLLTTAQVTRLLPLVGLVGVADVVVLIALGMWLFGGGTPAAVRADPEQRAAPSAVPVAATASPAVAEERRSYAPQASLAARSTQRVAQRTAPHSFALAKQGEAIEQSEDACALNAATGRYAVADGVRNSFLPGRWAQIVATGFVNDAAAFETLDVFAGWLARSGQDWRTWAEHDWAPRINALRREQGKPPGDWSREITRKGPQATLIGCSVARDPALGSPALSLTAIGDAQSLLLRPAGHGRWQLVFSFPFTDPGEFSSTPATLPGLSDGRIAQLIWNQRKATTLAATAGDVLVLASDSLSKWLLQEAQGRGDQWQRLIANEDPGYFAEVVRAEQQSGRMEDDDVTMVVIPL